MAAVGASLWRRGEFGTAAWDRRPAAILQGVLACPSGAAGAPEVPLLEPAPGTAPSPRPPVRIVGGSGLARARAERVFV